MPRNVLTPSFLSFLHGVHRTQAQTEEDDQGLGERRWTGGRAGGGGGLEVKPWTGGGLEVKPRTGGGLEVEPWTGFKAAFATCPPTANRSLWSLSM